MSLMAFVAGPIVTIPAVTGLVLKPRVRLFWDNAAKFLLSLKHLNVIKVEEVFQEKDFLVLII